MTNNYRFTPDYQALILACLITHQNELAYTLPCLRPGYFGSIEATLTAESAFKYYEKYGHMPTFITLAELVSDAEAHLKGDREPESAAVAYAQGLAELDTSDWKHVGSQIIAFAREQACKSAFLTSYKHFKEGTEPPDGFSSLFDAAQQVGKYLEDRSLVLHQDLGRVVEQLTDRPLGIPTGYALLDEIWPHGWQPGWLVVPLAPPKRYKTSFCLNIALNLVSTPLDLDVLYYSCEISKELALIRTVCNAAGCTVEQMYDSPQEFRVKADKSLEAKIAGNLFFTDFPSKTVKIGDIRVHAKQLTKQHSLKPKLIIIDYAETVQPTKRTKDEQHYRQQANIYTDARALANELSCVVLMPDRCNQEAASKTIPDMTAFQGAFEKAGIVDVALALCATEEEHIANTLRVFTLLNRHGPQYTQIRGRVHPTIFRIELEEVIPYQPYSNPKLASCRSQKTNLR